MNLFEIALDYRQMADALTDLDLPDEVVRDTLEAEGGDLAVKAQNIGFVVRNLETHAAAIRDAELQMAARRKATEARAERLRRYLLDGMLVAGISKLESPYFAMLVRNNPPSVEVFDEKQVPADYLAEPPEPPPPKPDKKLIAKAIKDGFEVPGCRLVQGKRLEIK